MYKFILFACVCVLLVLLLLFGVSFHRAPHPDPIQHIYSCILLVIRITRYEMIFINDDAKRSIHKYNIHCHCYWYHYDYYVLYTFNKNLVSSQFLHVPYYNDHFPEIVILSLANIDLRTMVEPLQMAMVNKNHNNGNHYFVSQFSTVF